MPLEESRFDFVVCRAAFKNFADPLGALNEMHRVLKPGGTALIIDLRRDATWQSIKGAVNGMNLGMVNSAITKLTFRFMLLKRAYTRPELQRFLIQTKFASCDIRENPMGFELSLTKAGQRATLH
jgi:ubiquinone/menaquinone biosynthesis C-methylase UbiE